MPLRLRPRCSSPNGLDRVVCWWVRKMMTMMNDFGSYRAVMVMLAVRSLIVLTMMIVIQHPIRNRNPLEWHRFASLQTMTMHLMVQLRHRHYHLQHFVSLFSTFYHPEDEMEHRHKFTSFEFSRRQRDKIESKSMEKVTYSVFAILHWRRW